MLDERINALRGEGPRRQARIHELGPQANAITDEIALHRQFISNHGPMQIPQLEGELAELRRMPAVVRAAGQ